MVIMSMGVSNVKFRTMGIIKWIPKSIRSLRILELCRLHVASGKDRPSAIFGSCCNFDLITWRDLYNQPAPMLFFLEELHDDDDDENVEFDAVIQHIHVHVQCWRNSEHTAVVILWWGLCSIISYVYRHPFESSCHLICHWETICIQLQFWLWQTSNV